MYISKLLLIDAGITIKAIPIFFWLLRGKTWFIVSSKIEGLLKKLSHDLPNQVKLLELENQARLKGSGIEIDSILGNWKFLKI